MIKLTKHKIIVMHEELIRVVVAALELEIMHTGISSGSTISGICRCGVISNYTSKGSQAMLWSGEEPSYA